MSVDILIGDCRQQLATLPDASVHCCVTSPPYFGLRTYLRAGHPEKHLEIGLEETPDQFISNLVDVFRGVRRVLRDDGTLWLNIGDSYAGSRCGPQGLLGEMADRSIASQREMRAVDGGHRARSGAKPKDLIGIPWMLAFALRADGWFLRQDIIWSKPNPMPESVVDRCTKAHEYMFLLSKGPRYHFDQSAIAEPISAASIMRLSQNVEAQAGSDRVPGKTNGTMKAVGKGNAKTFRGGGAYTGGRSFDNSVAVERDSHGNAPNETGTRNRRSVWEVATQPFKEAHFATFPPALIEPCILAGCPVGGTVLDPFGGSGTTAMVAQKLGRSAIHIDLNDDYEAMAESRVRNGNVGLPLGAAA